MTVREQQVQQAELRRAHKRLHRERRNLQTRAYWGTGKKIDEYRDAVVDAVDLDPLKNRLDDFTDEAVHTEDGSVRESLIDDLIGSIDFEALFAAEMTDKLREIVSETFKQGGSRVITVDGERLDPFDVDPRRIMNQLSAQDIYLQRLSNDAEERVRDTLMRGVEEGKTIGEMQDEVLRDVDGMVESRAETIARSEVTKASSRGTQSAMEEAGVERVKVAAEVDRRTCESGAFSFRAGGRTFTSCREWDGEVFDRESAPVPVGDSHPNCRCALLAVVD